MSGASLVSDPESLRQLGHELRREPLLALDTEADSLHSYRGKLCLIQVATPSRVSLVDALALEDLSALAPALAAGDSRVVMHGADYDLRILDRDAGLRVRGIVDTMIAASLLGRERVGLANLLEEEFGVQLDKSHQRADWSRRPLPDTLRAYAAEDTRHLPALYERLAGELDRRGRLAWAREEFRLLEEIRHEASAAEQDAWQRVKGSSRLDARARALLRELWRWRESEAQRLDRPPFKVLGREAMLEIARRGPRDRRSLLRIPGVGRTTSGRRAAQLLAAVARGLEADPLPRPPRPERPERDPVAEASLRGLKAHRDERARALGLDPGVLLPNAVLERMVAAARQGEDPLGVSGLRHWQAECLGDGLRPFLPPSRRSESGRAGG